MTDIKFKEQDLRCLIADRVLSNALKYIYEIKFESEVVLDFRGCFIDYGIYKVFDYVVSELKNKFEGGRIIIKHDLRITDDSQMGYYTYKKSDSVTGDFCDLASFASALKSESNIDLSIEGE